MKASNEQESEAPCVLLASSGDAHPTAAELRIAWDGHTYTERDFSDWYGSCYRELWLSRPLALQSQPDTAGATEHAVIQMPTLQCAVCERNLCDGADLAFFRRVNSMLGTEVHLMLRPEVPVPETFKPSADIEKGALQTWLCECGAKLGDTRPIAVRHAPMTAFKSAAVILGGQRFRGQKSKWPSVYNTPPFNQIEVRERDTYLGIQQ